MIAAPCFRTVKRWGPYCGDCSIFLRLEELGHPSAPTRRRQTTGRDLPTSTVCAAPIAGAPGRRQRTPSVADGPPVHRSSKSTSALGTSAYEHGIIVLAGLFPSRRLIEYNWVRGRNDVGPSRVCDRREPRASSRHLWHLSELIGVRASS